ncbi:hypothetical protein ACTMU2_22450 [Cupriavidus basilensis]
MFRPDSDAKPNWVGNLKQYQLNDDKSTNPPTVFLADASGAAVENTTTGFVNPDVTSIWTVLSSFWDLTKYPLSQGSGGASDAPDGDLVEKGRSRSEPSHHVPDGPDQPCCLHLHGNMQQRLRAFRKPLQFGQYVDRRIVAWPVHEYQQGFPSSTGSGAAMSR